MKDNDGEKEEKRRRMIKNYTGGVKYDKAVYYSS